MPVELTDVRIFIPRIRRELDPGTIPASAAPGYTDDMLKDVAADAVGELQLLLGTTTFPYTLSIQDSTPASAFTPDQWEYETDPEVPLVLHNLVAVQAAITQVYREAQDLKTQERISDEGSAWEYTRSATLIKARIDSLIARRKEIIERLKYENPELVSDSFVDTLNNWSTHLSEMVEPGRYDNVE